MLDIKFIRENPDFVKEALRLRNYTIDIDLLLALEDERKRLQQQADELRSQRNIISEEIGMMRKLQLKSDHNIDTTKDKTAEVKVVSDTIKSLEETISAAEDKIASIAMIIPNIPHATVPIGKDETANVEIRRWSEPRQFNFTPLNHWDIAKTLDIIDFDRAAKIAGARFALMKGHGARLERALMNFMLDHNGARGYKEIFPPILVNRQSMTGTGQLPKFAEELFRTADPEFYLVPTAEVPVTNIHAGEILKEEELPIYYTAYTPCFRREAGSYGKDTRGLIRQHQFNKIELVKFVKPEHSYDELEGLTADAADILEQLGLPYRVMLLSTGDIGFSAAKTYDIEVWLPGQTRYREISSCSNFEDFQARRAKIRFKRADKKGTEFVHTLNGSGLAIGRTVAAIIENYQQKDGSVVIPDVLRTYMGIEVIK
ncbi:MAG: serine--tRNA ligase [Candidatus Magnetominusculus sp. LBB02]|nr:serine--tRNA ligase [Candidatus Magnetominusculus sp. LBB02]